MYAFVVLNNVQEFDMKKLSISLLSDTVISRRKALKMTQADLAKRTGMNRSMLSKLETQDYTPSIDQLQALGECLGFEPTELFLDSETHPITERKENTAIVTNTVSSKARTTEGTLPTGSAVATTAAPGSPYNIAAAGTGSPYGREDQQLRISY